MEIKNGPKKSIEVAVTFFAQFLLIETKQKAWMRSDFSFKKNRIQNAVEPFSQSAVDQNRKGKACPDFSLNTKV